MDTHLTHWWMFVFLFLKNKNFTYSHGSVMMGRRRLKADAPEQANMVMHTYMLVLIAYTFHSWLHFNSRSSKQASECAGTHTHKMYRVQIIIFKPHHRQRTLPIFTCTDKLN